MSPQDIPSEQVTARGAAPENAPRHDHDSVVGPPRSIDVPPAFYRDDDVPPPPPNDPHWREWPHHDGPEPIPREILIGLPVALGVLGILHILAILLVLHLSGLY